MNRHHHHWWLVFYELWWEVEGYWLVVGVLWRWVVIGWWLAFGSRVVSNWWLMVDTFFWVNFVPSDPFFLFLYLFLCLCHLLFLFIDDYQIKVFALLKERNKMKETVRREERKEGKKEGKKERMFILCMWLSSVTTWVLKCNEDTEHVTTAPLN